jgi:hypothetical protein
LFPLQNYDIYLKPPNFGAANAILVPYIPAQPYKKTHRVVQNNQANPKGESLRAYLNEI